MSKQKGRPEGSTNRKVEQADAPASRCRCGSTRRKPYFNLRRVEVGEGQATAAGEPFTAVLFRRTECLDCGQFRDDRQLVNEPKPKPKPKKVRKKKAA